MFSFLRSAKFLITLLLLSSLFLKSFAQNCNIEITITGRAGAWADRVHFQLIDGANNIVVKDGGYGNGVFTKVYNYNGVNPPYKFKIDIIGDVYADNAVNYSVKVGGVQDRNGTLSTQAKATSFNDVLTNSFAGCSNGGTTPCVGEVSWNFYSQEDLDNFAKAYGNCKNIVLKDVFIGMNLDGFGTGPLTNAYTSNIANVSALYNVTRITGKLEIENNLNLTDINGLMNLTEIGGNLLEIKRNPKLGYCNNIGIKNYLAKSSTSFPRTISGNIANCLDEAAIESASNSTCPSGDQAFSTQEQIDNFGAVYSNCTSQSIGNLIIQGADIVNLQPLQKIKSIAGNLVIRSNSLLENLNGLENISNLRGYISIVGNAKLKNIVALNHINVAGIETTEKGIEVRNNPLLRVCSLPNVCNYLGVASNPRIISGNGAECVNDQSFLDNCGTLPVKLLSYTANTTNGGVELQWQTSVELNNDKFEIYRSGNDKQFVKIETVVSLGENSKYSYLDKNPLIGNNYYQLMQVDKDGSRNDLGVKYVNLKLASEDVKVYPNPTIGRITVFFNANVYQYFELVDLNGKTLNRVQIDKKDYQKMISLANYPEGIYLLKLVGPNKLETVKVIKN